MSAIINRLTKNEYLQTLLAMLLVIVVVFSIWYGSQIVLNTNIPPALAVVSGSMDMTSYGQNQGGADPFSPTLQIGDLIIIQGVDANSLNVDYPNSDIIVFHRPDNPRELIVHRIVSEITIDGKLFFFTKGDGNPPVIWPYFQENMYDKWYNSEEAVPLGAVSQDLVIGKVILRIPLIGYIPMFVQAMIGSNPLAILPVIFVLIILLLIMQVVIPIVKRKATQAENNLQKESLL